MKTFRSRALLKACLLAGFLPVLALRADTTYNFQTLNNPSDPAFNQLLGINDANTIAGYFGDGEVIPNKGYTLTPPSSYLNENFPGSFQTQVIGINNRSNPTTVGFYIDAAGNNFGFVDQNGTFTPVKDPLTPFAGPTTNQLLGVNDNGIAAGFFLNGAGNPFGYLYDINGKTFTSILFPGSQASTATGVNDNGLVTGFYTDPLGNVHGFLYLNGLYTRLDDPNGNGTDTMLLGLNNLGQVVGSFVDNNGETQGLVYNLNTKTWQTISDPNASANAAFMVTGTTVNGINDQGTLVGFYSDGTNVNGFRGTTPEPASFGMLTMSGGVLILAGLIRRRRTTRTKAPD